MSFENMWQSIERHAGETFHTISGKPFTYAVTGNSVTTDRTGCQIHRNNFEKASSMKSISGPGDISNAVRGPSYVWAILNDGRISGPAV